MGRKHRRDRRKMPTRAEWLAEAAGRATPRMRPRTATEYPSDKERREIDAALFAAGVLPGDVGEDEGRKHAVSA